MKNGNKANILALCTVAALGLSGAAFAENGGMGDGQRMMDMFTAMDTDKDGKVTQAEMDAHKAARVAEVDANKDGLLSADELAQMQIIEMTIRAEARAAEMVTAMDTDADGLLSAAEMTAGPRLAFMMDTVDTDGDGAISLAEMEAAQAMMGEHRGKHGDGHGRGGDHSGFWGMFGGGDNQ